MADTKISDLTPITSPQDPTKMYVPLFAQDGTPLNARMNFSEIFKTPVQMNLNAVAANSAVIFSTPADGRLLLTDYAGTSFGRLQLGGITAAYPSLKRNATGIDFRLADDSGYAPITAAAIISSSTIAATGAVSGTKFTASNTVTTDNPALDAAQTWNAGGVAFNGIKLNVTDTASAAGSNLLALQVSAVSRLSVNKTGLTAINGPAIAGNGEILTLTTSLGTASLRVGSGNLFVVGGDIAAVGNASLISGTAHLKFGTGSDAGILYTSAGALKVTDGGSGFGTISASGASITPAWSGTGTATTPLVVNITADPGPANAASKLLDLQVGGSTVFGFRKDAILQIGGTTSSHPGLRRSASTLQVYLADGSGFTGLVADTLSANSDISTTNGRLLFGASLDLHVYRDNADILALRRAANRQSFRIYNTYNGTNDEYLQLRFNGSNVAEIYTVKTGAGIARTLSLGTDGVARLSFDGSGDGTLAAHLRPSAASTYQIGGSGLPFSNVFSNKVTFGASNMVALEHQSDLVRLTNNSTGPGVFAIDNVQGTAFERLKFEWASNVARIGTSKGTGGTARDFAIITDDTIRMVFYGGGGINTGGNAITAYKLQQTSSRIEIQAPETPASASAAGNAGEICWDANYIYVCIASGTWRRIAHATW